MPVGVKKRRIHFGRLRGLAFIAVCLALSLSAIAAPPGAAEPTGQPAAQPAGFWAKYWDKVATLALSLTSLSVAAWSFQRTRNSDARVRRQEALNKVRAASDLISGGEAIERVSVARSLTRQQDGKARRLLDDALVLAPRLPQAYRWLGVLNTFAGRLKDAERNLRAAIEIDPAYADAHHSLGIVLDAKNLQDEAAKSFEEAARLNPDSGPPLVALGEYHREVAHRDRALELFRRAVEAEPDYAAAHFALARVLARQDRSLYVQGMMAFFDAELAAAKDGRDGDFPVAQEVFYEAEAHYSVAIKLDPGFRDAWLKLIELYTAFGESLSAMIVDRQYIDEIARKVASEPVGSTEPVSSPSAFTLPSRIELKQELAWMKSSEMGARARAVKQACARLELALGNEEAARELLDACEKEDRLQLQRAPDELGVYCGLAGLLAWRGRQREAVELMGVVLEKARRQVMVLDAEAATRHEAARIFFYSGRRSEYVELVRTLPKARDRAGRGGGEPPPDEPPEESQPI